MSYLSNTGPLLRSRVNGGCPGRVNVYRKTDNECMMLLNIMVSAYRPWDSVPIFNVTFLSTFGLISIQTAKGSSSEVKKKRVMNSNGTTWWLVLGVNSPFPAHKWQKNRQFLSITTPGVREYYLFSPGHSLSNSVLRIYPCQSGITNQWFNIENIMSVTS